MTIFIVAINGRPYAKFEREADAAMFRDAYLRVRGADGRAVVISPKETKRGL